jgi:hypothetical protein
MTVTDLSNAQHVAEFVLRGLSTTGLYVVVAQKL